MNWSLKKIISYSILFIFPFHSFAGKVTCADARKGIYKTHGYGDLVTIIRSGNSQTETSGRTGNIIKSDIVWTSDCKYYLSNRKLLRGIDSLKIEMIYDTIFSEITEINNSWTTVVSRYGDSTFKADLFNVDTSAMYNELTALEQFREYKGGKSTGTFSNNNYVITCLQHPVDKTKYILAFEEALSLGTSTKYKLLDHIFFTLDSTLKLATVNCRYNDMYDKEIACLYFSNDKNSEALIIKAWRFSKASLKIIEEPIQKVKYKEADKYLIITD